MLLFSQVEFLKGVLRVPIIEDAREASAVTLCGICSHSRTVRNTALASTGSLSEDAGCPVSLQTDQYSQKQEGTCYSPSAFHRDPVMLMKAEAGPRHCDGPGDADEVEASLLHYGAPRIDLGFSSVTLCRRAKSPVASDDDICVCLPSVSFLCLSCSCLAADGNARECPPAVTCLIEQA